LRNAGAGNADSPQDGDDIRALLVDARDDDIGDARNALGLIEARGWARDRPPRQQREEILAARPGRY